MPLVVPEQTRTHVRCAVVLMLLMLPGCGGIQSALQPAGENAQAVADLFWLMGGATLVIWLGVVLFAIHATLIDPTRHDVRTARFIIVGGGVVFPVIVLTALLIHGLRLMPDTRAALPAESLRIEVSGEQWWWRVRYRHEGQSVATANEIHLPVDEPAEFILTSPDVIHSFWIPSLAGKMDMTPGRTTRLVVTPTKTGTFRGACAEYCGASHARMNFIVVVHERDAFDRWLENEAMNAMPPANPKARRGEDVFMHNGCGACHTVRGTAANGRIGPDLTHVGSRLTIAAGTLPNDPAAFRHWLENSRQIKPEVHMPAFGMLADVDLDALAHYLDGLE